MAKFPQSVAEIITRVTEANGNEVSRAVEQAVTAITALPEFPELVNTLITEEVRNLVYAERHRVDVKMRNQSGVYALRRQQVVAGPATAEVYRSVYGYYIGGRMLGDLTGAELVEVAQRERSAARGHTFNAALAEWLVQNGVPANRQVRDAIPESRLGEVFHNLKRAIIDARDTTAESA